jgi:hypothetical protein
MLLTKSQMVWIAFILAPKPAEELENGDLWNHNGAVYRKFGLLEIDLKKGPPIIGSAKCNVIPADYFWESDDPYAIEEVTMI